MSSLQVTAAEMSINNCLDKFLLSGKLLWLWPASDILKHFGTSPWGWLSHGRWGSKHLWWGEEEEEEEMKRLPGSCGGATQSRIQWSSVAMAAQALQHHYSTTTTQLHHYNTTTTLKHHYTTTTPLHHYNTTTTLQHNNNTKKPLHHYNTATPLQHHYNTATPLQHH